MAFKLTELFVEITGDDAPLGRTLDGVFSTLTAGVGLIGSEAGKLGSKLVEVLTGVTADAFEETIGSSEQVGEIFGAIAATAQGAMSPFSLFVDVVRALLKDNAEFAALMGQVTTILADTGKTILDALMPAFEDLQGVADQVLRPLLRAAQETLSGFAITAGEVFAKVGTWIEDNKSIITAWGKTLKEWVATAAVLVQNYGIAWEITVLTAQTYITNAGELISWFFGAAATYLDWFKDQWPNVFRDAFMASFTIASNVLRNLRDMITAFFEWAKDPSKGFDFKPTGLLDGYKATMKELPKIAAVELTKNQDQFDALFDKLGLSVFEKAKKKIEEATAAEEEAAGPTAESTSGKTMTTSLEDFSRKLQEGVFRDDTAKKTLDVQKTALEESRKQTTALNKIAGSEQLAIAE